MSDYDNDHRVLQVNDGLLSAQADNGVWLVFCDRPGEWWSDPHQATIPPGMTREQANEWARTAGRGPFPTADAAIRDLIGEPR